jgi:multiple sugar transport system permease protein
MPIELEQAAMVDGCGFLSTYARIMMPNAKTSMMVVLLFSLVWYWNDYFMTSVYCPTLPTMSMRLSSIRALFALVMQSGASFDPYQIVVMEQAACVLMILPLLILYVVLQKQFTEGIERSGIVG